MSASPKLERRYTPEDLLTMEDGSSYELIDGQLVEKPVSAESSATGYRIGGFIEVTTVAPQRLGRTYGPDVHFRAFPWAPQMLRMPDAAFIRADRLIGHDVGIVTIAPDWVLEAISPNDTANDVREKVDLWLRAGVRLVWVASTLTREIDVYRPGHPMRRYTADEEITGEDVIPGLRVVVGTLFPVPLSELVPGP